MAIKTRQTDGTGVTNENAPLTNEELDNNFIELVAEDALKANLSGAAFTGQVTISTSTENALDILAGTNNQRLLRLSHPTAPTDAGGYFDFNSDGTTDNNVVTFGVEYSGTDYDVLNIQRSTQRVGIGTILPITNLDIIGANDTTFDTPYTILLQGSDAYNSGNAGSGIVFAGEYNSSEERTAFATISGIKENTTDGNFTGALLFGTRKSSGLDIESMRLDSSGNLGVNNSSPSSYYGDYKLVVGNHSANSPDKQTSITIASEAGTTGYLFFSDGTSGAEQYQGQVRYNHSVDRMEFVVNSSATTASDMSIDSSGRVGIGTVSQTQKLEVNGSAQFANSIYKRFQAAVATNTKVPVQWKDDGTTTLNTEYTYEFELTVTGTGTNTGAKYIAYYRNPWFLHCVSRSGSVSNHPQGIIEDSQFKMFHTHPSTYTISCHVKATARGDSDNTQGLFGADGVIANIDNTTRFYTGSDGQPVEQARLTSSGDFATSNRLLNSQGARLHNEPASGLLGTGMNMTNIGAVDTGVNYSGSDANARGIVWTGKYYIVVNYAALSGKGRFYRLNGDLSQGEFKNGSVTLDHNETDLFYPHGGAWDGRYLAVVGRDNINNQGFYLNIFDVDNLTSGYATRIAKIDLSAITGGTGLAGIGYAEGLYWIRFGTALVGFEVDLASQTATVVINKSDVGYTLGGQAITYDGSHLYITQNGEAMYQHSLDGDLVASQSTGNITNCTALTWNGQEFIGIRYDTGDIYAIPVTHESYSHHYIQGNRVLTTEDDSRFVDQEEVTATVPASGWYRVAQSSASAGRGDFDISVFTTGGNYTPQSVHIRGHKTWQNSGIITSAESSGGYWNAARITTNGTNSWLEVYFTSSILSGQLRIEQRGIAYNRFSPLSGTLSAGGDTVIDTLDNLSTGFNSKYLHAQSSGYVGAAYDYRSNTRWFINNASNTTPATSGTTQNCPLRIRGGDNAVLDFGVNGGSGAWIQATNATSLNLVYPLLLNQNGGNVGINTDSPEEKLEVNGNLLIAKTNDPELKIVGLDADDTASLLLLENNTSKQYGFEHHYNGNENIYKFRRYDGTVGVSTDVFTVPRNSSNVTFAGEIQPQTLTLNDINGTVDSYWKIYAWDSELQITTRNSNGTFRSAPIRVSYTDSDVIFEGEVTVNSDERIKDNIEQIDGALEKVQAIRGVTFTRNDTEDDRTHVGVIAQEVEKVLPEVVKDGEDGIKSVAYANMVGLLIEAIKEQQTQIDDLKAEVTRLKGFE
jgi:hypothetical protein